MAGLGRKVFTSGEILTAADLQGYAVDQSVMVFDDSTARGSAIPSPSEGMVTYLKDVNQVQAYDGSSFLPVGGILQVVSTTKTDTFSMSSSTFTDVTGLSVSITPTSTTSKVLVFVSVSLGTDTDMLRSYRIMRDSTAIAIADTAGSRQRTTGTQYFGSSSVAFHQAAESMMFLDSPGSTSALSYHVEVARLAGAGTVYVNRADADTDTTTRGRTVSNITVMEVAG